MEELKMIQEPNKKPLSDPTYNFGDFKAQLLGGRLRWLATILALSDLGLLLSFLLGLEQPRIILFNGMEFNGATAYGFSVGALAVLLFLAILNWRNWLKG